MGKEHHTCVLIILLIAFEPVFADSWIIREERYRAATSENGNFAVYVTPPKEEVESFLEVIEIKGQNESILWKSSFKYHYPSFQVYITNDGCNVVIINLLHGGYGD